MNSTIWKYKLYAFEIQDVNIPEGAVILTAQFQGAALVLWALVNPNSPTKIRKIEVIRTGQLMPEAKRIYISTTQIDDLVFHVFERE